MNYPADEGVSHMIQHRTAPRLLNARMSMSSSRCFASVVPPPGAIISRISLSRLILRVLEALQQKDTARVDRVKALKDNYIPTNGLFMRNRELSAHAQY